MPLSEGLVTAIRAAGLDTLLDGSEQSGARSRSLVKCVIGYAAFDED